MHWTSPNPAFTALLEALTAQHASVHIVGGAVRDLLLGRTHTVTDLDLVVESPRDTLALARRVADQLGWAYYALDEARDVARLVFTPGSGARLMADIAAMRGDSIEVDLSLRDFTVNALAISNPLTAPRLVDPTQGQRDLAARLVRRVNSVSLADDPIRLLRAVRFAAQLDFDIEHDTAMQIRRLSGYLSQVSPERIRDELWKSLDLPRPTFAVRQWDALGLLPLVLPEVAKLQGVRQSWPHVHDVYEHSLAATAHMSALIAWITGQPSSADEMLTARLAPFRFQLRRHVDTPLAAGRSRGSWLVWMALLHDIGKPSTRTVEFPEPGLRRARFIGHEQAGADMAVHRLNALRFSRAEVELAQTVILNHMRPHHLHASFDGQSISPRATFRFFRDIAARRADRQPGLDVLLLALADVQATYGAPPPDWDAYLDHIASLLTFGLSPQTANVQSLVNGAQLMQRFSLSPGAQIGALLEYLLDAQMAGELTTQEDAYRAAAVWLEQARQATP